MDILEQLETKDGARPTLPTVVEALEVDEVRDQPNLTLGPDEENEDEEIIDDPFAEDDEDEEEEGECEEDCGEEE